MRHFLKKIISKLGYTIVRNKKENSSYSNSQNGYIESLGININKSKHAFVFDALSMCEELVRIKNAKFYVDEQEEILYEIDDLKFKVSTWEEVFILKEVFVKNVYNLKLKEDFILFDIGMNVATTSIYFSSFSNCKKVFGFEPFESTLQKAKINMNLNIVSTKIETFNFGLGYPDRVAEVLHSEEWKGSVGILSNLKTGGNYQASLVSLVIKDVYQVTNQIVLQNCEKFKIVFKIDCEGAEYEIISRMSETSLLKEVDILMIEWHLLGTQTLEEILKNNGFDVLVFGEKSEEVGMLYAFNSKR